MIGCKLANADGVTISQNVNFYVNDLIDDSLYAYPKEVGVHLNDKGTSALALNTKMSICRALKVEIVKSKQKNFKKPRYRHNRRF